MVKGVRAQGPGRKEAREGRREGCFRSPISHRMVKPETSGHERCQMGLERAAIGPRESRRKEVKATGRSRVTEADVPTAQGSAWRKLQL